MRQGPHDLIDDSFDGSGATAEAIYTVLQLFPRNLRSKRSPSGIEQLLEGRTRLVREPDNVN
jgi:hypothetical protein